MLLFDRMNSARLMLVIAWVCKGEDRRTREVMARVAQGNTKAVSV
jgi:hypothetical protein